MLSLKESLKILKKTDALLEGHFILSSGLHSNYYVQCAKLLSFPNLAKNIVRSLAQKIKHAFKNDVDLILSPAMGGVVIGYEIGRLLNVETIFCERVNGKFEIRRGFHIKKRKKVLITLMRLLGVCLDHSRWLLAAELMADFNCVILEKLPSQIISLFIGLKDLKAFPFPGDHFP